MLSPFNRLLLALSFNLPPTPIECPADLLQVRQIRQAFVHPKIVRVPESSFRPAAASFFEVLLQIEVFVVDVQARMGWEFNFVPMLPQFP